MDRVRRPAGVPDQRPVPDQPERAPRVGDRPGSSPWSPRCSTKPRRTSAFPRSPRASNAEGSFRTSAGATREEVLRSIIALLKLDDEGDRETLLQLLLARDAAAVVPVGRRDRDPARAKPDRPLATTSRRSRSASSGSPSISRAGRPARLRALLSRQPDDPRAPADAREDRLSPRRPGISRGDPRTRRRPA